MLREKKVNRRYTSLLIEITTPQGAHNNQVVHKVNHSESSRTTNPSD